ncbi:MAG: hypothetical protein HXY40_06680 [Chloroflexi bacterium]|nr:hypothetical protein [Chloroflexota bacterium]
MAASHSNAPIPDLRIVPAEHIHPHEEHDPQRSIPLIEQLKRAEFITNPPIVSPVDDRGHYVILDGANRCYSFQYLGYAQILVQVIAYESGYVELDNWHHIIGGWDVDEFLKQVRKMPDMEIIDGHQPQAVAHVYCRDGRVLALRAPVSSTHERNETLCSIVRIYQQHAKLHRTAMNDPHANWDMFPDGSAMVVFPRYQPQDIIAAARYKSFLPPGVSRHIVHGRALSVNYPLELLRDEHTSLEEKNTSLKVWIQGKMANRQVRYYAEATYQFGEYE